VSEKRVLWCARTICEERAADGTTVVRRVYSLGEQVSSSARFFARDHLDSVTDILDSSASLIGRYGFDPWGRRVALMSAVESDSGFTGHVWESTGELWLTLYRPYDAELGRWLSQDPLGLQGGSHLSRYVSNAPITFTDPLGLFSTTGCSPSQVKQIAEAVNSAISKVTPCCAEKKDQRLITLIDQAKFICKSQIGSNEEPACAQAPKRPLPKRIELAGIAFNTGGCGDLACTIIHEAVHLTQWIGGGKGDEVEAQRIERNCCGK
jgi:RHS repeat-associated protein